MAVHVAIEHRTTYRFDRRVALGPHLVRLRPAPHCRTPITAYSLEVEPSGHFVNWQQDPFANHVARLVFPEKTDVLDITVDLVADLTVINPFDFFLDERAGRWPFAYDEALAHDLVPYLVTGPGGALVDEWLAEVERPPDGIGTVEFLVALNQRLQRDVAYTTRMEPGVQAPEETLRLALGSCRDTGWLLVQLLRRLGLAARFVSGYLVQLRADEAPLDGPAGAAADFTDLHAWAEVFVPGAGWIGLDPTSGLFAGEGHIPLACTPDPVSAAPIVGATDVCEVEFAFANRVTRVHEDPRVTLPYTDVQWQRIDALGRVVDARLAAADVRLTQGGEPTFVSADDFESAQWATAADGPEKRALAGELARRLADHFAPGGIVQHGQGKWYPGEALPRWQTTISWRADGEPLWTDPAWLDDPTRESRFDRPGRSDEPASAERFVRELARRLGLPEACCVAAYEDAWHALWSEARQPFGDRPADATLPEVDAAAAIDGPAGWALPVHWDDGWRSSAWRFRRGALFLLPGDSPIGLRMPLGSIAWAPPEAPPERSPFDERGKLGADDVRVVGPDQAPPTAVCAEERDGRLHVFLPPLTHLEHFVRLVADVERTAAAIGRAVVLEGYPPPADHRLRSLSVAPDPGVIEVNVPPAATWHELTAITEAVHRAARHTRLGTERFDLDGGHTGTGGGNHMTLGGPTPADSPMLRRPDLLRSLITYFQHHPSLSYLFSGRFIGPTSQGPRVDEARDDALYELEIAFQEMDRLADDDGDARPWLVDRLLRHLLTDVSGNTHRAEFCIDKLFSPDGERGRLGLVELRAFEMPPHPRMALAQALLVRALVARCWDEPYRAPLVRWGTELHDRFLLPWHVAADAREVCADLAAHGIAFDPAWLDPFLEFRFPRLGSATVAGVTIELRAALEPWLVLGEEPAGGATARYVDSSVERLQVRADGLVPERHLVTCNGVAVPMRPTGTAGVSVAGVRYRAWQPPSALHPTIGVHTPLVFDLVDRWSGRSLGGCTYHVTHPGGRSYERFPVNAMEAEARRVSRFEAAGHTPGPIDLDAATGGAAHGAGAGEAPEYPRTLDLRRASRR